MDATVGDDVLGDDPTVRALEERIATLLGKEAAIFVPSGTMANQIGIRLHTQPGDEVITHEQSHIYQYETAGPAALSGCTLAFARGARGMFTADEMAALIRPEDDHFPPTRCVVLENTHNKGGGSVWPIAQFRDVCARAHDRGIAVHLDGARLWNACIAANVNPSEYTRHVDTVSCCFSKGLGAPVGSALAMDAKHATRARRFRKMFGGGMRQSGFLAAAALYALDNNYARLADDHANARRFADQIARVPGIALDPNTVQTNIVYFDVDAAIMKPAELCSRAADRGVLMFDTGPRTLRAVTHLHISGDMVDAAAAIIAKSVAR